MFEDMFIIYCLLITGQLSHILFDYSWVVVDHSWRHSYLYAKYYEIMHVFIMWCKYEFYFRHAM